MERRRNLIEDGRALLDQQAVKGLGIAADGLRNHYHAPAVEQSSPQLPHRKIERVRVEQGPHVPLVELELGLGGGEEARHIAVRNQRPRWEERRVGKE